MRYTGTYKKSYGQRDFERRTGSWPSKKVIAGKTFTLKSAYDSKSEAKSMKNSLKYPTFSRPMLARMFGPKNGTYAVYYAQK